MVRLTIPQDRVAAHQQAPRGCDLRDLCTLPLRYRMIRAGDRRIILQVGVNGFNHDPT